MPLFATFGRLLGEYRARRRYHRTVSEIMKLPAHVRKDIGWPQAFEHHPTAMRGRRFRA